MPSEHCAPISEQLRESGTNLQHPMILQAARHYCPPHPASLLLRRLCTMTRSTVQLTLGNYSPLSKLCSTLLLPPPLPTSLLITLLPFSQRKWQPSGNSSTNCPPPLRAQPSIAHLFLLSPLSARVRSPKS